MPLNDDLIHKAIELGGTSINYRIDRREHVNTTWVCLIFALLILYFPHWGFSIPLFIMAIISTIKSLNAIRIAINLEEVELSSLKQ